MGRSTHLASFAALAFVFTACAHSTIPGTEIEDTEENREILDLVEEYQRAVESLDADAVLALVSPRYYEDNGNTDTEDDYGYAGLADSLRENFARTKTIQLTLRVDDIAVEESDAYAELYYQIKAQNEYPSGTKWETGSDRTRLRFERVDDQWKIVAGL